MTSVEGRLRYLEDLEAIRALDARYCRVLDAGDWDALVALFTDDGEFVGLGRARGHDELRAFFGGLAGPDGRGLTAFWHHVTNLEITFDEEGPTGPDRAWAQSLLWQPCVLDGVAHIAAGHYHDTLARGADGSWRYQRKQVSFDYFSPLVDGWSPGRFSLPAAAAATASATAATQSTSSVPHGCPP